jgi:hypothetical protein
MISNLKKWAPNKAARLIGLLVSGWAFSVLGCGANYGNLKYDNDVKQMFESYEVRPDYRYYYSGSDASPNVIIGIKKEYQLKSQLWKPVDLTADLLKSWLNFPRQRVGYDPSRRGSYILGPDGKKIGVYYANRDWRTWSSVKLEGENLVLLSAPTHPNHPAGKHDDHNAAFGNM